jgi:hypothetical protein
MNINITLYSFQNPPINSITGENYISDADAEILQILADGKAQERVRQ